MVSHHVGSRNETLFSYPSHRAEMLFIILYVNITVCVQTFFSQNNTYVSKSLFWNLHRLHFYYLALRVHKSHLLGEILS